MASNSNIVEVIKDRQLAMRREMDRRGIAMKAVSFDSGIPYSTLLSYFPGDKDPVPALMPVSAQYMLCGAIPDDVLSLLLPVDRVIVRVPEAMNHDELAEAMTDYLAEKQRAHRPDSECAEAIGPGEHGKLASKVAHLRAVA